MEEKIMVFTFSEKEQTEIKRIVLDEDKVAALEFLKRLDREIKKREQSQCGVMFNFKKESAEE
ncbi:MAG: hypothetical protein NC931_03250 [Candidatus Omnitrophica bacterium]|nr:hypothetical protein [Candidatus Omnitrophota bacterium]